jgi:hypothetical protein
MVYAVVPKVEQNALQGPLPYQALKTMMQFDLAHLEFLRRAIADDIDRAEQHLEWLDSAEAGEEPDREDQRTETTRRIACAREVLDRLGSLPCAQRYLVARLGPALPRPDTWAPTTRRNPRNRGGCLRASEF